MTLPIRRILMVLLILLLPGGVWAQLTRVSGTINDALTQEPLPFATVIFKGTQTGVNTRMDGTFTIETEEPVDSIICSMVGYQSLRMRIKRGQSQTLTLVMKASRTELQEVTVVAGDNPAIAILKKIIDHKKINDPSRLESYQYEVYNKVEFDLTNITQEMMDKKLLKPFAFIWDNIDSSETNSQPFLPFFISETLSDMYYRKSPQTKKEYIRASKVSGLENASVTQFLGDMYQRVNVYDDYIDLFAKGFISPINDVGQVYYKYYLLDSAFIGEQWCYHLKFKPRFKAELVFSGDFWVHDSTWAIRKINMRISPDANLNWVEDMAIVQEYEYINREHWMLTRDMLVLDFSVREEGMGFIGRKNTSYSKIQINHPIPEEKFNGIENIIVADDALNYDEQFWDTNRHDSLSLREQKIYHMVDTIKTLPAFRTYVDIITLIFSGYYEIGKIEIGPYYTFLSFNNVEGVRFRLGGRTSSAFSTRLRLDGYLAYGTKDQDFKYSAGIQWKISDKPRQFTGFSILDDIRQFGQSENAFQDDNLLSSLFRSNPSNKLSRLIQEKFWYDVEWFAGLSNKITLTHSYFSPVGNFDFRYFADDSQSELANTLNITEIGIYTRFLYREKFVSGKVDRVSIGSAYPTFQVNYRMGLKDFLGGDYNYHKLNIRMDDYIKVSPFGTGYYVLQAGKTWGKVPEALLEIHPGNESYIYDYAAFNLMNYFEYVSDFYLSAYYTHHFDGFFLNKVPLMYKLKWREVAQIKAVWGSLSDDQYKVVSEQDIFNPIGPRPYVEAGLGVENIFKILRFDFLWRVTDADKPDATRFRAVFSLQLTF